MHRSPLRVACACAFVFALLGAVLLSPALPGARAQDTSTQNHPLVGVWAIAADLEQPGTVTDIVTFHADGTVTDVEIGGSVDLGGWEPTGPTTASVTLWSGDTDENGNLAGMAMIRVSLEVSADGSTLSGEYTIEFQDSAGTSSGEAGPANVTGTRLNVEAPGTPVMSMEELFSTFSGTPEATPAA